MNAIRAYEVLYSQVLRLSKDYQFTSDPTYQLAIQALCSDGSILDPNRAPISGKMSILMDLTNSVSGSLSMALSESNDNPLCPNTPWGITQAQNLLNFCTIFGFNYSGPYITPNIINGFSTNADALYFETGNTGLGLLPVGSTSTSKIISPNYLHPLIDNPYFVLFFGCTLTTTDGGDSIIFGLADQNSIFNSHRIYFETLSGNTLKIIAGPPFVSEVQAIYTGTYNPGDTFAIVSDFLSRAITCYKNSNMLTLTPSPVVSEDISAFFQGNSTLSRNTIFTNIQFSATFPSQ